MLSRSKYQTPFSLSLVSLHLSVLQLPITKEKENLFVVLAMLVGLVTIVDWSPSFLAHLESGGNTETLQAA